VLLGLAAKAQLVDQFQRVAKRIAALEPVFDFAENLADLVFDRVRALGAALEAAQVGEQLSIDVGDEVWPCQRIVMIESAILSFRRGPFRPAMRRVDDEGIGLPFKLRL
jgi:hypothetical protein